MASATAAALDAADGVIDGRHFGRPIVQAAPQFVQAGPQFASAYPAFGQSFGTQFAPQFASGFAAPQFATGFAAPTFVGGASSTAAALDAADGVIDGKHFGRQIVQAAPQVAFGAPQFASFSGAQFAPQFAGAQFAPTTFAPQFATGFAAPTFVGGASSTAAALDAADGVIDGKHFGRQIVQAAPQVGGLVPYTGVQQVAAFPQTAFAAAPTFNYGGAIPAGQYFGGQRFGYGAPVASYGQQFVGQQAYPAYGQQFVGAPVANYGFPQQFGAASRAAQLDAADGVIDGKFYGRQIVQRR